MLIITRRPGECVRIELDPAIDPRTSVGELFAGGAIEIVVAQVAGSQVKLGIHADPRLRILRDELCR